MQIVVLITRGSGRERHKVGEVHCQTGYEAETVSNLLDGDDPNGFHATICVRLHEPGGKRSILVPMAQLKEIARDV